MEMSHFLLPRRPLKAQIKSTAVSSSAPSQRWRVMACARFTSPGLCLLMWCVQAYLGPRCDSVTAEGASKPCTKTKQKVKCSVILQRSWLGLRFSGLVPWLLRQTSGTEQQKSCDAAVQRVCHGVVGGEGRGGGGGRVGLRGEQQAAPLV